MRAINDEILNNIIAVPNSIIPTYNEYVVMVAVGSNTIVMSRRTIFKRFFRSVTVRPALTLRFCRLSR
jgi:hypothetical protein